MRFRNALVALALTACGGGSDGPTGNDPCASSARAALGVRADLAEPIANAAEGTSTITIGGAGGVDLAAARASAFELGASPSALTVLDVQATDAAGRPTGELFVFLYSAATTKTFALEPVTLADLQSSSPPRFSFALYADQYDADRKDYARWLLAKSGCVTVSSVQAGRVGRLGGQVDFDGEWQTLAGQALGAGGASGRFDAPLLRILTPGTSLRDTLTAAASGARSDQLETGTVDAFQVLRDDQTRLLVVGTVPPRAAGDSVRELWLSVNTVPGGADVVPLSDPTLAAAMRGRAAAHFGMLRVIERIGVPAQPYVRQLWRSTSGSVTFTNVVQNGPLGLCAWASGRYEFTAAGSALLESGAQDLGTATFAGAFETKLTPLAPHDTVTDDAKSALLLALARRAAPGATTDATCTF